DTAGAGRPRHTGEGSIHRLRQLRGIQPRRVALGRGRAADPPLRVHPTPVVASPALGRARTHSCRGGFWARRARLVPPLAGLSIRKIPARPTGAGGISPRRTPA